MDEPVTIRYRFTPEEYRKYKRAYAKTRRTPLDFFEADSVILSVLMMLILYCDFRQGEPQLANIVAAVYVILIRILWYKRGFSRYLNEFSARECEYQFWAGEIIIRKPSCIISYDWSAVKRVISAPEGFLIFLHQDNNCIWIPKTAWVNSEMGKLADLLRSKTPQFKTVK